MASRVGQYCIYVSDLERSVEFYTALIGLKEQSRTDIPGVNECVVAADHGGGRLQLAYRHDDIKPVDHGNALWKIYMIVDDADAVHDAVVAAGYESTMKPERLERWPVKVGFVVDPDGYLVELVEYLDGHTPPGS
ncbi:MAG: VOC family protein [Ilumatobacteraceae bacterium]|jgi:lactoylglutathione lyase